MLLNHKNRAYKIPSSSIDGTDGDFCAQRRYMWWNLITEFRHKTSSQPLLAPALQEWCQNLTVDDGIQLYITALQNKWVQEVHLFYIYERSFASCFKTSLFQVCPRPAHSCQVLLQIWKKLDLEKTRETR